MTKRGEYPAAGIPQYWMVDQDPAQTVTMHHRNGDHYAVRATVSPEQVQRHQFRPPVPTFEEFVNVPFEVALRAPTTPLESARVTDRENAQNIESAADRLWARTQKRPGTSPRAASAAILIWTRVHGIVSLELTGIIDNRAVEAQRLIDLEINAAIQSLGHARH